MKGVHMTLPIQNKQKPVKEIFMTKLNIYQKINKVMQQVEAVQKESKKVNGQYTFVSHDAVAAALHMPMAENGIVMVPSVGELVRDGNMTIVRMDIEFVNSDAPEEKIKVSHYGYGIDPQDKGVGKAVSYAVKYALLKMFCLETGDDVEKDNTDHKSDAVTDGMIHARKKLLFDSIGKDTDAGGFFDQMAKTYKKTVNQIVMSYEDVNKFVSDFSKWKEINQSLVKAS